MLFPSFQYHYKNCTSLSLHRLNNFLNPVLNSCYKGTRFVMIFCRTQYTTGIDHPYSCETEKPTVKKCSKYICEICGKVIHSACNLNRHVKSHFRFTDVMCSCCGKCIGNFQCWTEHKQNCTAANNIL